MTKSRIRIQTFESGWTLAGAAVWDVLPLPADAESTTLRRLYAAPADDAHDPVKVALVPYYLAPDRVHGVALSSGDAGLCGRRR